MTGSTYYLTLLIYHDYHIFQGYDLLFLTKTLAAFERNAPERLLAIYDDNEGHRAKVFGQAFFLKRRLIFVPEGEPWFRKIERVLYHPSIQQPANHRRNTWTIIPTKSELNTSLKWLSVLSWLWQLSVLLKSL